MRKAFTFLELVFVIVIMGILANFGTNILLETYTSFTASTTNNKLLANIELTLKQISNRMQYRIKDSVISRPAPGGAFASITNAGAGDTVIEWIGYDIDGWLGTPATNNLPTWSGFIDVDDAGAIASSQGAALTPYLESPGTSTAAVAATIVALANGSGGNPAIFFTGANSNVMTDYGWNGAQNFQVTTAAHPVTGAFAGTQFGDATTLPAAGVYPFDQAPLPIGNPSSFRNTNVYENYKLAWTAYGIAIADGDADGTADDLVLYYDYQPWNGGATPVGDANRQQLLLQNVNSFTYQAVGETIKIQVCVDDQDALGEGDGGYAICEEIAIF